jgi:hypothetical protein
MFDPSKYKLYYFDQNIQNGKYIKIEGVNNLSFSKNLSFSEQYFLGGSKSSKNINSPQQIQLTFDRTLIQQDFLFNFTGKDPISKFIVYDGAKFSSMNNMYLTNYSAAFSVGDLPKINTTFMSYGQDVEQDYVLDYDFYDQGSIIEYSTYLPSLDSISLNLHQGMSDTDFKASFKIYSFDYNMEINRQPYYSVGSSSAVEVSPILPLKINSSINSKVIRGASRFIYPNIIDSNKYIDYDISVTTSQYTATFPVRNGVLVNFETQLSSQNTIEIKRNFLGSYGLL